MCSSFYDPDGLGASNDVHGHEFSDESGQNRRHHSFVPGFFLELGADCNLHYA